MKLSRVFILFSAGFSFGSLAGSFDIFSRPASFSFLSLLFILFTASFIFLYFYSARGKLFLIMTLAAFSFASGLFWYGFNSSPGYSKFEDRAGARVKYVGIVSEEPDERENHTKLVVAAEETGDRILVTAHRYPSFNYGDKIEVNGIIQKPEKFLTENGEFDWPAYLLKDDIRFEMFYPELRKTGSANAGPKGYLFGIKNEMVESFSKVIPEPYASFLGGLTFGAKRGLPEELLEKFKRTGVVHIVVLSGYNITIVAEAVMRVLGFLPTLAGTAAGFLGIIAFALMTGGSATVVRASIMSALALLARATGRVYEVTIALFIAALAMIVQNPKIIRFDASFQLSFLATISLIYVAPILKPRLKFIPQTFQMRELASATISTQLFVMPMLLYKTGAVSVVSLPVNLLILALIPLTMLFGFATAVSGLISYLLSLPLGWITYAFLRYEIAVVEFFSSFDFSSVRISAFPLWAVITAYAFYAVVILLSLKKEEAEHA